MDGFPNILLNFANACEDFFEGTGILHCPQIARDIKYCQSKGKTVVLSMGGASGAYGFSSNKEGADFADVVWDMFFKGESDKRPFDDAVLDGIDLDIEGGAPTGYSAFIKRLRGHYAADPDRKYYIAAAPQCPFPDAYLGSTLNNAWFDMVFVQFYNNYCGVNAYPGWFNFKDWDNWAKTESKNKDVKVFIGVPGSPSAASSGYIDGSPLSKIYKDVVSQYSSIGGIMTWDVSQARGSGLAKEIRSMLDYNGSCGNATTSPTPPEYTSSSTPSPSDPSPSHSSTTSTDSSSNTYSVPSSSVITSTTTVTKTVTSVSTFISTERKTTTIVSPYTSYITTVMTYTETVGAQLSSANATSGPVPLTETRTSTRTKTTTASRSRSRSRPSTRSKTTSSSSSADDYTDSETEIQTPTDSTLLSSSSDPPTSVSLPPISNTTVFSNCPVEGMPCLESTQGCNQQGYALCIGGKWAVYPCSIGTSCYLLGNTAACDWEGAHAKDACMTEQITPMQNDRLAAVNRVYAAGNNDLRPLTIYTMHGIGSRIEFTPVTVANSQFQALIKVQTLIHPIPSSWKLQFRLPLGQHVDTATGGRIMTNGTLVAIISEQPKEPSSYMAISIEIGGRFSGVYHIPDFSTAVLSAY
ncbi:Chitinase 2 [Coemansia sp. IMI 203386]|nr:Chitinase 2 [Coemansia sp. IMI 203386]